MVKGTSKRVIVVKSPDPRIFEEAIFVIREDFAGQAGVSADDVLKEAQQAASSFIGTFKAGRTRRIPFYYRLPAPFVAAVGAAATGITWLAVKMLV